MAMPPRKRYVGRPFSFRLEIGDDAILRRVAEAKGLKPAAFARKIVAEAIKVKLTNIRVRKNVANAELLRAILVELLRQGNNINQLAKIANQGRRTPIAQIEALLSNNQKLVSAFLSALSPDQAP
jgi:hypothetical protein